MVMAVVTLGGAMTALVILGDVIALLSFTNTKYRHHSHPMTPQTKTESTSIKLAPHVEH